MGYMSDDGTKQARGAARKAAMERGERWIHRPARFRDRKKEASRKACRGRNDSP